MINPSNFDDPSEGRPGEFWFTELGCRWPRTTCRLTFDERSRSLRLEMFLRLHSRGERIEMAPDDDEDESALLDAFRARLPARAIAVFTRAAMQPRRARTKYVWPLPTPQKIKLSAEAQAAYQKLLDEAVAKVTGIPSRLLE